MNILAKVQSECDINYSYDPNSKDLNASSLIYGCARKCCNQSLIFYNGSCNDHDYNYLNVSVHHYSNAIGVLHLKNFTHTSISCKHGMYQAEIDNEVDAFFLQPNGTLYMPNMKKQLVAIDDYCLEAFLDDNNTIKIVPVLCGAERMTALLFHYVGKSYYKYTFYRLFISPGSIV